MIGEIDCREGLLIAVERDHYASLKEGMERTIDVFIAALVKIIAKKKFNVRSHQFLSVAAIVCFLQQKFYLNIVHYETLLLCRLFDGSMNYYLYVTMSIIDQYIDIINLISSNW